MKHIWSFLFMGFLIFLFFSKSIVSSDKAFAPLDLVYSYKPWSEHKQVSYQNFQQIDEPTLFIPWRFYNYQELRKCRFPLYNPYEYGGLPFFANDQSGVLSPYNLISLFFDFQTGFLMIALFKLFAAALGMYLFLNLFSLNKPSLIIGSIAYTFSALMITWLYHPVSSVVSLIPWFFWASERLSRYAANSGKGHVFSAVLLLALIIAISFFCGHSETTVNVLIGLAIYSGTSILINDGRRVKIILYFGTALILGLLLSSIHIIPFLQLLVNSEPFYFRSQVFNNSSLAISSHLPLYMLITWLVPNIAGNPSYNYFILNMLYYVHEAFSYIGIVPLLLGLSTLRLIKTDYKRLLPLWTMIVVGFGMAYKIPVFSWLTALPIMRSGASTRYVILMEYGFCALAAFGLNALMDNKYEVSMTHNKNKKAIGIVVIISGISVLLYLVTREHIGLVAPLFDTIKFNGWLAWVTPERLSFIVIQILITILFITGGVWFIGNAYKKAIDRKIAYSGLIILSIVDLFIYGIGYNPDVSREDFYPETPLINELQTLDTKNYTFYAPGNTMPANIAVMYHLRDFRGYDMVVSDRYQNFVYLLFPQDRPVLGIGGWIWWKGLPEPVIASMAGIKYFIFPTEFDPNQQGNYFTLIGTYDNLSLWDNELAKPVVYAASRVVPSDDDSYTMGLLSSASVHDIGSAIVQGADGYHDYDPGKVEIKTMEDKPGKHVLMVNARADGFLVINEPIYPGWHAYINDKPVDIYPTNYLFQGIKLMPGKYMVKFEYMPKAFVIGAYLSILTAVFMILSGIMLIFVRFHFLKSRSASE